VIPGPRGAAEPTRIRDHATDDALDRALAGARDAPGWLTVIEGLDRVAAGVVARFEHELGHAGAERARQLRRQAARARRVEAATAAAVEAARRGEVPAAPSVARP
jgi:hypothetical protein